MQTDPSRQRAVSHCTFSFATMSNSYRAVPIQATDLSYGWGWRHIITALGFWAFFCTYMLRVNINVAIVAMVNKTTVQSVHGDNNYSVQLPACLARENGIQTDSILTSGESQQNGYVS